MSLQWNDLQLVLALHRGGSLAAAAGELDVDPSTVSRRLKATEAELGVPLFDRTPDGLVPTDVTLRLLAHAEQAEAAVFAARHEVAGASQTLEGEVTIAAAEVLSAYTIAPALPALLQRYPGLRITLTVSPGLVDLSRREADLAVRFVRPTSGDLVAKCLGRTTSYGGYASRAYAERAGKRPLAEHDWIGWGERFAHLAEARLLRRLIGGPPRIVCDDMIVMMELMRAGGGVLLLPGPMAATEPDLVRIHAIDLESEVGVWLVCHRALRRVGRVAAVWDWLEDLIVSQLTEP